MDSNVEDFNFLHPVADPKARSLSIIVATGLFFQEQSVSFTNYLTSWGNTDIRSVCFPSYLGDDISATFIMHRLSPELRAFH